MRITRIRLRRFKRFADWQAGFAPGFVVVRGPNEAGKTTVMDAVFEGLFGAPGRSETSGRLRSWGEQRLGEITIELQADGGRYLLRKDLEAGTILLQSEDGRERLETFREIQKRILDWIGLGSESVFRATAFVGQADLARVGEDRRVLAAHTSRVLSGAGVEGVQDALEWLRDRREHLAGELQTGRGIPDRVAELRAQQAALRQREERAQRHRIELRAVVRRIADVERDAAERAEALRTAASAAELQQRERSLLEEEAATREQLARAEDLLARLALLDGELAEFSSQQEALIADLFHARRQYLQLESSLAAARDLAEREERMLEHLATRHHTARLLGGRGWVLAGAGGLGVVGGVLILSVGDSLLGLIPLIPGAAATVVGLRTRGRITGAGADYRTQEQRVLDLRRKVEVTQRQLGDADAMVAARLQAMGGANLEDVERRYSRYVEALREREDLRASLRQGRGGDPKGSDPKGGDPKGGDPKAALEDRLRQIADELAGVRSATAMLPRAARRSAEATELLEQQTRHLTAELGDLRERRARLEGVLDEMRDRGDEAARLDEEIAALEALAGRARQALEVIELTARMLEEARSLSVYPARELLERRVGEYLAQATGGAYGRIAMDERTLRPQVWVQGAGAWKDAADLSQATRDQLYICLRLALLDVIAGDRRPPLLLDEPFAHLDESRRQAMVPLLVAAARHRQVVLFTCWRDYDAAADQVVVLERA